MLTIDDVANLLGFQRQTIIQYRSDSKPGKRYAKHPFPEPDRVAGRSPLWNLDRWAEIEAWAANRPGFGARFVEDR